MAYQGQNYFQKRTKPKGPKANERIRAPQVQVISSDGKNLGTLDTREAINIAKREGLDLIEISPNAILLYVKLLILVNINMIYKKKLIRQKRNKKLLI